MNYPVLGLIITNIIWGAAAPIFKYALTNIPPFTLAFIRFAGAAILFLPLVLHRWRPLSVRDVGGIFLASFLGITLHISFFFLGLQHGVSINAPIIAASGPIFLYIFALLFLKEKARPKVLVGMLVSLVGVSVIIFSPLQVSSVATEFARTESNIFFLISTFGIVASAVVAKRVLKRVDPFQFTFIAYLFSAVSFYPQALTELQHWSFSMLDSRGILGIVYGVIFSSLIAYFFFYWGTSKIDAQEIGVFQYIDPVAAILVAAPLLGEYPTPTYLLGALLVFLGIFVAEGRLHWHPLHKLAK